MAKRLIGIDVARALAVFGMVIVNFKVVFGNHNGPLLNTFLSLLNGKAAATFVVLAGVGIALTFKRWIEENDIEKFNNKRLKIFRRAIVLFLIGASYLSIWPADILHFYGIYMLITLAVLKCSQTTVIFWAAGIILLYIPIMMLFNYDLGWDFEDMKYTDLWTLEGFLRNLLYNGFHPVVPWTAFMLIGLWFGRMDLSSERLIRKVIKISLALFLVVQIISYLSISFFPYGDSAQQEIWSYLLGTSPMPPLPMYMITGSSFALLIISTCILMAKKWPTIWITRILSKTGQLALTFYVAHVILGMGIIEIIYPNKM